MTYTLNNINFLYTFIHFYLIFTTFLPFSNILRSGWGIHPTDINDPDPKNPDNEGQSVDDLDKSAQPDPNDGSIDGLDPNNGDQKPKKRKGRPKGSKNKPKTVAKTKSNSAQFWEPIPKSSQRKRWFFTMNNYAQADVDNLQRFFDLEVVTGGFQAEIAPRTGTKHIQGFFILSRRMRFQQFGLKPDTHFEAMRGSITDCVNYVTKSDSFDTEANIRFLKGVEMPEEIVTIKQENFFEWQQTAHAILQTEPDERVIYWKFDDGNTGKSAFVKWACVHMGAIMISGKGSDVKHGVVNYIDSHNGIAPKIIFVDIPRSVLLNWNRSYTDFSAIEAIKNGNFFSDKYDSKQVIMNAPHVMIFANNFPNLEMLTRDRWDIREIKLTENELQLIEEKTQETVIEQQPQNSGNRNIGNNTDTITSFDANLTG